jgi:hypothetical protein
MNIPGKYLNANISLTIDSLNASGQYHSGGMQGGVPRKFAHAVSHFEGTIEKHAIFH